MNLKSTIRYSEAFKLQVIREVESGRFSSLADAERTYGIRGRYTINEWMIKYGKSHLLGKVIHVKTPRELDELKDLRKQVRELKQALADAHLDACLEKAYVTLACEMAGIKDVEAFKKKCDGKRSR